MQREHSVVSGTRAFSGTHHILLCCDFQGLDDVQPVPAAHALHVLKANVSVFLGGEQEAVKRPLSGAAHRQEATGEGQTHLI